jgi:hypothetical protein
MQTVSRVRGCHEASSPARDADFTGTPVDVSPGMARASHLTDGIIRARQDSGDDPDDDDEDDD